MNGESHRRLRHFPPAAAVASPVAGAAASAGSPVDAAASAGSPAAAVGSANITAVNEIPKKLNSPC